MPPVATQATKDMAVAVLRDVAIRYPQAYANCHRDENQHPEHLDFAILGLRELTVRDALFGLNGKRGDKNNLSSDALAYGTARDVLIIDFLIAAGEHGNDISKITWHDVTEESKPLGGIWVDPFSRNTHINYGAPGPATTKLSASAFPLVGLFKNFRQQLDRNMAWYANTLKSTSVRGMMVLGGDSVEGGHDPWSILGYDVNRSDFQPAVKDVTKHLKETWNLDIIWCIIGARPQVPNLSDLERMCDIAASIQYKYKYQMVNEYGIWNKATINEMRHMVRRMRSLVGPSISIDMSSPNTTHVGGSLSQCQDEVRQMYNGLSEANAIGPHWNRDNNPPFIPGCDLGPFAPAEVINSEWFGPGSSGVATDDPVKMGKAYQQSIRAKESEFVVHSATGAFWGHLDPHWPDKNPPENVYDQNNMNEIARVLVTIKNGGTIPPEIPDMPRPDRGRFMAIGAWLHEYYQAPEGLMRPEGLWINGHPDFEGQAAWQYDVYLYMIEQGHTDDEARAEITRQIRHSQEWKDKHPGETP